MSSISEIRIDQRRRLFQLLTIKAAYSDRDTKVIDDFVIATEAEMEEEDVAWVEKKVGQLSKR